MCSVGVVPDSVLLLRSPAHSLVSFIIESCRGVAQPGSAPALGAGGPRFKSARPDQTSVEVFAAIRLRSLSGTEDGCPCPDFSFECGSALGGKVVEQFVEERRPEVSPRTIPGIRKSSGRIIAISGRLI